MLDRVLQLLTSYLISYLAIITSFDSPVARDILLVPGR